MGGVCVIHIEDVYELPGTVLVIKSKAPHTMEDSILKFHSIVILDACVMRSLCNDRVIWSSELIARCIEWVLHVVESVSEVVVN